MRTLLVTGPGGAGRTTLASAAAVQAARQGHRTLLIATGPTDTAGAALGTPTGPCPVAPADGLTALRPDPAARFRSGLLALQRHAGYALGLLGALPLDDDELTPLPGSTELALLHALHRATTGSYDLVVVDLPPTEVALAALVLPEQLRRYLRRLLPQRRRAAGALRPVLGRLAGVPVPSDGIYEAAVRWDTELAVVQSVIEDRATTVHLVAEPGEAGADAVRTAAMGLALYGLRCDALVANRLLPDSATDPWLASLAAQQRKTLDAWAATCGSPEPHGASRPALYGLPHLGRDPRGLDDLMALTAAPGRGLPAGVRPPKADPGHPPGATAPVPWPLTDRRAEDGVLVWHIPLPGALRDEIDLVRRGDEVVITAGPFRRVVDLPSALRRCTVDGAGLADGELRIRFRPDPALWPEGR